MYNKPVYWAHFNAEQAWQDNMLATLPSVTFRQNILPVPLLDEVFIPENNGIALTLTPQDPALTQFHQSLGLSINRRSAFDSVAQWFQAQSPDWISVFDSYINQSNNTINKRLFNCINLLIHSPQKPYSIVPDAMKLPCLSETFPDLDVVININSKSFVTELCHQEGIPCDGVIVCNAQQLHSALFAQAFPFVIKEAFGVSGKGSLVIKDRHGLKKIEHYLLKQMDRGKKLNMLIQPWLEKEWDFSSQWVIDKQGQQHLQGLSLIKNEGFKFVGAQTLPSDIETRVNNSEYFKHISKLLTRISQLGYTGPLGIDSMLLTDSSIYPVVEVNARESMGSIAQRWFNALGKNKGLTFTQCDIAYNNAINFEWLLNELKQLDLLFNTLDCSGIFPIASSNLQLPCHNGKQKGRWYQIHSVKYDRNWLKVQLDSALKKQGASCL